MLKSLKIINHGELIYQTLTHVNLMELLVVCDVRCDRARSLIP